MNLASPSSGARASSDRADATSHQRDGEADAGHSTDLAKARYEEFTVPAARADGPPPSRASIEAACAKVLASRTFGHSERHRTFLDYLVRAALDGRALRLKETVVGLDVFGRALNGFDPGRDSIVRVEARRLRMKLERYYDEEGQGDAIAIRLPVGSYVPRFEWRQARGPMDAGTPLFLVLPFSVCVDEPEQQALAVAIADQSIHLIGSRPGLRVVAPMVALRLRGQDVPFDALRRQHAIDYVVDGSIVGSGSRLRCIAHLSRTSDQLRLWSGRFEFDASGTVPGIDADAFAFQDRIAETVAAAATGVLIDH